MKVDAQADAQTKNVSELGNYPKNTLRKQLSLNRSNWQDNDFGKSTCSRNHAPGRAFHKPLTLGWCIKHLSIIMHVSTRTVY